ncbi:MAG: DUF2703 domain-containing protein [bacterium]
MMAKALNFPAGQYSAQRKIGIDFLFLDLNTCTRCVGTNENLEKAVASVEQVLHLIGAELTVNKILIDSTMKAQTHRFVTSPTIRVNGQDIAFETRESKCDSCTDLCGCAEGTDCRIWAYRGEEYTEAPVAMIAEAILQEVFRTPQYALSLAGPYDAVPENLQSFFANKIQKEVQPALKCCSSVEQQSCCEPSEKASCCSDTSQPGGCGCK